MTDDDLMGFRVSPATGDESRTEIKLGIALVALIHIAKCGSDKDAAFQAKVAEDALGSIREMEK